MLSPTPIPDTSQEHHAIQTNRDNNKRKSLEGALHYICKQKIYDVIINRFHKQSPKIQSYYKKLCNDFNESTLKSKAKADKRSQLQANQYHTINLTKHQKPNLRRRQVSFSKQLIPTKRESVCLPVVRSLNLRDQGINLKDKRLQDLFLRIGNSSDLIYNVSFPKKLLLDYISLEFSVKFAVYLNWFMQLRPTIDYYYYVSVGNRLLKMDTLKMAHFAYSLFDGFSYQNSLEVFMHDYGSQDLMSVIDNRKQFNQNMDDNNLFQRKTLSELQGSPTCQSKKRTAVKSNTLYRKTFLYNELGTSRQGKGEKRQTGGRKKEGQINFQQFCGLYGTKTPEIYKQVLKKLYYIQIVDTDKGLGIDRSQEAFNRERNVTRESLSPVKVTIHRKKRFSAHIS